MANDSKENSVIQDIPHEEVHGTPGGESQEAQVLQDEETKEVVLSLEQIKKSEISKFDLSKQVIAGYKKKYGKLTIASAEDRDGYKKVLEAWRFIRGKRLAVANKHKEIKATYLEISRAIDSTKNELTDLLDPIETHLKAEIDRIDGLKEEAKQKAEKEKQERLQGRVMELIAAGVKFDGSFYSIGDTIALDVVTLAAIADEDYATLLDKVKAENQKIIDAAAEKLRLEEAEKEALRVQGEEQEAERKRLQDQKDELDKQKKDLEESKQLLKEQTMKMRGARLESLGMVFSYTGQDWSYAVCGIGEVSVFKLLIEGLTDQEFGEKYNFLATEIKNLNDEKAEKERKQKKIDARSLVRIQDLMGLGFVIVDGGYKLTHPDKEHIEVFVSSKDITESDESEWAANMMEANSFREVVDKALKDREENRKRTEIREKYLVDMFGMSGHKDCSYCRISEFPEIPIMRADPDDINDLNAEAWGRFILSLEGQHSAILKREEEAKLLADQKKESDRISLLNDRQRVDEWIKKQLALIEFPVELLDKQLSIKFFELRDDINTLVAGFMDGINIDQE